MSKVREILSKYPPDRQKLINILHEIQDSSEFHYLTEFDMQQVAEYFNTTKASVYGVVTYYSMLSTKPRGRNIIRVCKSPVCHVEGAFSIIDAIKQELGIKEVGETSSDRQFTLEYSECLGQCASAPGMLINEDFFGNLDDTKIREILGIYRKTQ
jgi:NADH:ubiquinone oxidoreductase subunit E